METGKATRHVVKDAKGFLYVDGVKTGVKLVNGCLEFHNKSKTSARCKGATVRVPIAEFSKELVTITEDT